MGESCQVKMYMGVVVKERPVVIVSSFPPRVRWLSCIVPSSTFHRVRACVMERVSQRGRSPRGVAWRFWADSTLHEQTHPKGIIILRCVDEFAEGLWVMSQVRAMSMAALLIR